ncbi:MAG: hypothetical protein ABIY70_21305 [Capsulimonas sp.]|uniref:hypothetical protein n=1 Tax=Capsulimonas sp. TaxID=2494211 RepID=UPI0032651523
MTLQFTELTAIDETPEGFLERVGHVFARFDERTQDSGNISFGVEIDGVRYFVKTAGLLDNRDCSIAHGQRTALLWNAKQLWEECPDPAFPRLEHTISASPWGPVLFYEWLEGELLGESRERRNDPDTAFQRFRRLPSEEIERALETIYRAHDRFARMGWVAVDFYDGSLLYDFKLR